MTDSKKSPHQLEEDRLSFSLSEEEGDDTADSLDIKPPQATALHRKPPRRKRERILGKEERHVYNKSHHSRNEERRKDHKDDRYHREREAYYKDKRSLDHQKLRKERERVDRDHKSRRDIYQHKEERIVVERRSDFTHKQDAAVADLRGKLLDRRANRTVKIDGEPDKKRIKREKKMEKERIEDQPQETEKERVEREQRDERKAKLLEAEREMAHRKEVSRRELEARRERHNIEKAKHRMMREIVRKHKLEKNTAEKSEGEEGELADQSDEESEQSSSSSSSSSSAPTSPEQGKSGKEDTDVELEAKTPDSAPPLEKSPVREPPSPRRDSREPSDEEPDDGYFIADSPKSDIVLKSDLPPYLPAIQGCRSVEEFTCLNRIEEGTYGVVYRARDKRTADIVALKRLKMEKEKEGFPITSLREINTLLKAQHPNIVTVREIVVGSNMDKIFIVMDYVEHDLKSLMETMKSKNQVFVPGEIKCLMIQLLRAVNHLHDNWILHRDLKTSNLLLSHKGILKVGDFGLAREYGSPLKAYTPIVVTLWYRAPELLLQCKEYTTAIDVWSVGCIYSELLQMEALFAGRSEMDQLNRIFKELGTPNEKVWPGYNKLPAIQKITFAEYPVNQLKTRFGSKLSELGLNLLNSFLTYNPVQRITTEEALKHEVFKEMPLPIDPAMFPTWPAKSEQGIVKKGNNSPKAPSGGKEYKQLGDTDDEVPSGGFHMGGLERRANAVGPGFSLKF